MSGWIKFENTTPESIDRKAMERDVQPLSDKAFRLYFNASCYCSRGETDGKVAAAVLPTLAASATKRVVAELVAAGLLDVIDDRTYMVHDYLAYNPSRSKIQKMRAEGRERMREWRGQHAGDAVTESVRTDVVTPTRATVSVPTPGAVYVDGDSVARCEREIFDYWREKCGHPEAKFTAGRRAKVKARLREGYTVEQIRQAIDGAAKAAFVNEAGHRFDDLELICRSGEKLESFIARRNRRAPQSASAKQSELDAQRLAAARRLMGQTERGAA